MTRIAVIGNAGGGKTTMSERLGKSLGIEVHTVDKFQWREGWVPAPPEAIRQEHERILSQQRWIIDGWGGLDLIRTRFAEADTIVYVDFPIAVHYWWALKRQVKSVFVPRKDLPPNCPMLPKTIELVKVMWRIHRKVRPIVAALLEEHRAGRAVFHLRSPRQLKAFLRVHAPVG